MVPPVAALTSALASSVSKGSHLEGIASREAMSVAKNTCRRYLSVLALDLFEHRLGKKSRTSGKIEDAFGHGVVHDDWSGSFGGHDVDTGKGRSV